MPKKYRDLAEIASDKNKDTEQRNLAGLIEAAVTNGLIALKDFDRGVFTFTSDGGLRTYRVFFDEPAEAKGAERIIRASEFVTAIFDKINTSYNCYFAPATNTRPEPAAIRERLFPETDTVITDGGSEEGEFGSASRIFELDFNIIVAVGDAYERLNDHIVAQKNGEAPDGTPIIEYVYRHLPQHTVAGKNFEVKEEELAASRKQAEGIVSVLNGNRAKKEVLNAFARAKKSSLRSFIDRLPDEAANRVGEINLQLTSVFVGAVAVNTYYYDIKDGKDTHRLAIVWNKDGADFNKSTRLYIYIDNNGDFAGLTFEKENRQDSKNIIQRSPFAEEDRLVIANGYGEGGITRRLTLLAPENSTVGEPYKRVRSCAVKISGISKRLLKRDPRLAGREEEYFLASDVEAVDGGYYLKEDVGTCDYTGKRVHLGTLTEGQVDYVDENGKILRGYVSAAIAEDANYRHQCPYCGKSFIADPERFEKYKLDHRLLNGDFYCDGCEKKSAKGEAIAVGSKRYRLYKNVRQSSSAAAANQALMVLLNEGGTPLAPADGGNLFVCGNCGDNVYKEHVAALRPCGVCGADLCSVCYGKTNDREKLANRELRICASCPKPEMLPEGVEASKRITRGAYSGKCLVRARSGSEKFRKLLVVEDPNETATLYNCLSCGDLVYLDKPVNVSCSVCGRKVCPACEKENSLARIGGTLYGGNMVKMRELEGALVCTECEYDVRTRYSKELNAARADLDAQRKKTAVLKEGSRKLEERVRSEILGNINNPYFPLVPVIHRMKLISAFKRDKRKLSVQVFDGAYSSEKLYTCAVEIKVDKTTFRFLNYSGKITLEEIK